MILAAAIPAAAEIYGGESHANVIEHKAYTAVSFSD
jgi:hypothetical protein